MDYTRRLYDETCEVRLQGKFTFSDRQVFKSFNEEMRTHSFKTLVLDLSAVTFVDSAALGILLLARDEAQRTHCRLILRAPKGQVKKMFEISSFHNLFTIEE